MASVLTHKLFGGALFISARLRKGARADPPAMTNDGRKMNPFEALPPKPRPSLRSVFIWGALFLLSIPFHSSAGWAWYDRTHIAVATAAGYRQSYNAAGADIAKVKAGAVEEKNHFFNNNRNMEVTQETVLGQAGRYNDPNDEEGHLYGAIISSLREFKKIKSAGKFAEYHMAFAAHYIGDLSQPLHNTPRDRFNIDHHPQNDGIVEDEVSDQIGEIQKHMYPIELDPSHFEEDLAKAIARIANISRNLGLRLKAENRDLTKEEAYTQLGHSASLLRAVLMAVGEISGRGSR